MAYWLYWLAPAENECHIAMGEHASIDEALEAIPAARAELFQELGARVDEGAWAVRTEAPPG